MSDRTHRDHPVADYAAVVGDDGQLVDVREPHEVAGGTLAGAMNIPLGELAGRLDEPDPSLPVVLLCRSGGRSAQAARFLTAEGFVDVVNLAGGMLALPDDG
ncbi:MAG: rhodanese-like domain-containing protein [Acidimicrobiales bacterium]